MEVFFDILDDSVIDYKFRYFNTLIQITRGLCIAFEIIWGLCTKKLNHRGIKCNLPYFLIAFPRSIVECYVLFYSFLSPSLTKVSYFIHRFTLFTWEGGAMTSLSLSKTLTMRCFRVFLEGYNLILYVT